jgi:hypothetical protein
LKNLASSINFKSSGFFSARSGHNDGEKKTLKVSKEMVFLFSCDMEQLHTYQVKVKWKWPFLLIRQPLPLLKRWIFENMLFEIGDFTG